MADFTRQAPGLNLALPPSSAGRPHEPGHLDETVQLVHPFLGPLARLKELQTSFPTTTGSTVVDSEAAGADECFYVSAVDIAQADAAQVLQIVLLHAVLGIQVVLRTTQETATPSWPSGVSSSFFPMHRPFLVPPGFNVRGVRATGGVGLFALRMLFYRYRLAESPPSI